MDPGISHAISALRKKNLALFRLPSKHRQMDGANNRKHFLAGNAVIHPHHSQCPARCQRERSLDETWLNSLVLGPWPIRQLDGMVLDVDKARLLEILSPGSGGVCVCAKSRKCFDEQVAEPCQRPVVRKSAVVAVNFAVDILQLYPPARPQVAASLISSWTRIRSGAMAQTYS